MKIVKYLAITITVLAIGLELIVRILGLADVPVRLANNVTGYIPVAGQHGMFLDNDWRINANSMISTREFTSAANEVIISGDSVVFGGNPLAQAERVGEQLDALLNDDVFSIADGSWALKNQLNYFLSLDPELREIERIVFVLNSGDFGAPSSWKCYSYHPTSRPLSHLFFVIRKYFYPDCSADTPEALIVPDYDIADGFAAFQDAYSSTQIHILLYQSRDEWRQGTSLIDLAAALRLGSEVQLRELLDFGDIWNERFYADGIHPSAEGARALAQILQIMLEAAPSDL